MVQILESVDLEFQSLELLGIVPGGGCLWEFDLFDGHNLSARSIEGHINPPVTAFTNEFTTNPLEFG